MKNIIYLAVVCFTLLTVGLSDFIPFPTESIGHAQRQRPTPAYAKWGNIAVQKTKEKYPNDDVVDYLHIGRVDKGDNAVEKFKLWLKGQNREFGVLVDVEFNKTTQQFVNITFKEVER